MKKQNRILLALAAAFVVLLAGASLLYNRLGSAHGPEQLAAAEQVPASEQTAQTPEQEEAPRGQVPDFTVYDAEGNAVKLSDFAGKPIVVNFWASWCGPCKQEMPHFQAAFDAVGDEVQFLMVNMTTGRETVDTAMAFTAEQGYTFPVYYDTASHAAQTYRVYSLPTTYFINAEGRAEAQAVGSITAETLQKGLDLIS